MSNVSHGNFGSRTDSSSNGGEPPMTTLDYRVGRLEKDSEEIKSEIKLVNQSVNDLQIELHKSIASQTKWIAATIISVAAISLTVAKFVF
ncbi:hypothetical protein L1D19_05640 [Vibrio natriegens]|uniref:hypothetical protein n=1 Tax=Vibrio natriegens TaxID=691 RepID=UPI001EFC6A71|nr:hypothetical protein [Vibrio natriegens]MCG9699613.1 hypothetical protein [Vibrio natriegens]